MPEEALRRLTDLAVELIPGGTAAAATIAVDGQALTFATSAPWIDGLHRLQFDGGEGPVAETLLHNEPRRVDDTAADTSATRLASTVQSSSTADFPAS